MNHVCLCIQSHISWLDVLIQVVPNNLKIRIGQYTFVVSFSIKGSNTLSLSWLLLDEDDIELIGETSGGAILESLVYGDDCGDIVSVIGLRALLELASCDIWNSNVELGPGGVPQPFPVSRTVRSELAMFWETLIGGLLICLVSETGWSPDLIISVLELEVVVAAVVERWLMDPLGSNAVWLSVSFHSSTLASCPSQKVSTQAIVLLCERHKSSFCRRLKTWINRILHYYSLDFITLYVPSWGHGRCTR